MQSPVFHQQKSKAPPSAFLIFCRDFRDKVVHDQREAYRSHEETSLKKSDNSNLKPRLGEVQKKLAELWRSMSEDEKLLYRSRAEEAKQEHQLKKQELILRAPHTDLKSESLFDSVILFPSPRLLKLLGITQIDLKLSKNGILAVNAAVSLFVKLLISDANNYRAYRFSGKNNLVKDDIVMAIRLGGLPFKFLESCLGIISDNEINKSKEKKTLEDGSSSAISSSFQPINIEHNHKKKLKLNQKSCGESSIMSYFRPV